MTAPRPRVVVIGGGLAGLAVAYRLTRPDPSGTGAEPSVDVTVLEASERVGGPIRSMDLDGFDIEAGPDSFVVRKPWALELCAELGLDRDVVHPEASGALVWARGRLVPYPSRSAFGVPSDAESLLRWPGMGLGARLRATTDLWRPRRVPTGDESIGSLVGRRLGPECARAMVGPLLAGINSGDPDRLSVRATFPELAAWEEVYGSLIRGARAARRSVRSLGAGGAERPIFASLRGGLSRLVEALAAGIGPDRIALRTTAHEVRSAGGSAGGLRVDGTGPSGEPLAWDADALVAATPAFVSAELLGAANPGVAAELAAIPYGSTAIVALGYPAGTAERLPDATGFIVPTGSVAAGRDLAVTACTWVSRKWPDERFGGRAIVRAFVGRAGDEGALAMSDPELVATVVHDLDAIVPLGAAPDVAAVAPWPRSMPQYEVGHLETVERIERGLDATPGVFVTGSSYRGVGIADVVRRANETASRVRGHLTGAGATAASAAAPRPETERAMEAR